MLQNYTEGGASEDGHHGDHISSLNHTIEQENYFFNPHLHPVTEQKFIVYGILIPVFGSISVFLNLIVYLTLFHKNRKKGNFALNVQRQMKKKDKF